MEHTVSAVKRATMLLMVLALCLCRAAAAPPGGVVTGAPQPKNVGGELLILDAGSLLFQGNHPRGQFYTSASACAAACAAVPGCNAYNFCARQSGCGSGCSAYAKVRSKYSPDANLPGWLTPAQKHLPITAFGPWTLPWQSNGCHWDLPSNANTDAWAYGMCTLKAVKDPSNPPYSSQTDEGWMSGTIALPPQCAGLPAALCTACLASASPSECLACAKDPRAQGTGDALVYLNNNGSITQKGCATCTGLQVSPAARKQCVEGALTKNGTDFCITNAPMTNASVAVPACIDCVAKHGPQLRGTCNTCAQQSAPKSARCFACLDTYKGVKKFCPEGGRFVFPPPADCWSTTDTTPCSICSAGAQSDAAFKACLDCYTSGDGNRGECGNCAFGLYMNAADQERCFKCVGKAKFTSSSYRGCADCFSSWLGGTEAQETCLACVESASTPQASKGTCMFCVSKFGATGSDTCVSCLKNVPSGADPRGVCVLGQQPGANPGLNRR